MGYVYYNEIDEKKAAALRQLIYEGYLPEGVVDTRDIREVKADELREFTQCHFFAGYGGWAFALQYAGISTDEPIWTGSCPCQSFSVAGKKKGKEDDRHLLPVWQKLIIESGVPKVFGEQVSAAIAYGWLDDVHEGLEAEGYTIGKAVLPACSVGAAHQRNRLWFVAYSRCNEHQRWSSLSHPTSAADREKRENESKGQEKWQWAFNESSNGGSRMCSTMADPESKRSGITGNYSGKEGFESGDEAQLNERINSSGLMADTISERGRSGNFERQNAEYVDPSSKGFWDDVIWIPGPDGKHRPVKPDIQLLVNGFEQRASLLHAAGDGIVPQLAAEFIKAANEAIEEIRV